MEKKSLAQYGVDSGSGDTRVCNGLATQGWVAYQDNLMYVGLQGFFVKNYQPGIGLERIRQQQMTGKLTYLKPF